MIIIIKCCNFLKNITHHKKQMVMEESLQNLYFLYEKNLVSSLTPNEIETIAIVNRWCKVPPSLFLHLHYVPSYFPFRASPGKKAKNYSKLLRALSMFFQFQQNKWTVQVYSSPPSYSYPFLLFFIIFLSISFNLGFFSYFSFLFIVSRCPYCSEVLSDECKNNFINPTCSKVG